MCLFPKLVDNPKYRVNKKNGGNVPPLIDERVKKVPIGCGYCYECRKKKSNEWRVRLSEDIKEHTNGKFITLTFSSESFKELRKEVRKKSKKNITGYALDNEIATLGVRRFLERVRKKTKKSLRHWLITELGHNGTENIHLHGIIYSDWEIIDEKWQYGYIWPRKGSPGRRKNYVSERSINYIVKYVTKTDPKHKTYKSKILCSPGIGRNYANSKRFKKNEFKGKETNETYRTSKGAKIALPIYYRNKAYTEEEREKLWLQKLDEGIRYIGGEKVDADDDETINKLLTYYQNKNNDLGYGNPNDWNIKKYENERRELLHKERLRRLDEKNKSINHDKKADQKSKILDEKNNHQVRKIKTKNRKLDIQDFD